MSTDMSQTKISNTLDSYHRKMAWILAPYSIAEATMEKGGLMPASRDVAEMEKLDSIKAIRAVMPIYGEIDMAAALASVVITDASLVTHDIEPYEHDVELNINHQRITAATRSVIAMLVEQGVLQVGTTRLVGRPF
jgi:hypothetical protein